MKSFLIWEIAEFPITHSLIYVDEFIYSFTIIFVYWQFVDLTFYTFSETFFFPPHVYNVSLSPNPFPRWNTPKNKFFGDPGEGTYYRPTGSSGRCWDTRIRTSTDRTKICSATITPYLNVIQASHLVKLFPTAHFCYNVTPSLNPVPRGSPFGL